MLVFGIDIPLVEIVFTFAIIMFLLLVEVIVIISLQVKQLNKTKEVGELLGSLSHTLLEIKQEEIKELDKLKK
ncbi:hypothetical protein HOI26_01995 [Candidatus Woesearchaeota archaeon]|jgi:hypothetical protein|nr:hypothetical protein [Candidatus Woesearchaeota archaeon]MBT5739849.1 hypothetical protein [Candidatus Woesearchaeota archaeon]